MADFHFLRPGWLLLVPVALVLLRGLGRSGAARGAWERICDPALLKAQVVGMSGRGSRLPIVLLGVAWVLACIALAGPTWERQPQPVYSQLQSRVVVFDLSRSMDSDDLAPSRVARARYKLTDLVSGAGDREQALVVFAGDAFVVSPLTDDSDTLAHLAPSLDTDTVPVQGSRVDRALALALELLERGNTRAGEVVLMSDGIDPAHQAEALAAAGEIAARGHRLLVMGVGTTAGGPVPLAQGGFLVDSGGNIVVPALDRAGLRELARRGGGEYLDMRNDNADIERWNQENVLPGRGARAELAEGELTRWVDRGAWLVLPLLLIAALGFRRGWLLVALVAMLPVPRPAMAFEWDALWSRPDQRAAEALTQDQPGQVPVDAGDAWQAAAAYRRGEFEEAARRWAESATAEENYNQGNALARSGDLESAASAYRKALELEPGMEDARFNLDLVEEVMERNAQQQAGGGQGEQSPSSDAQSQEGESSGSDSSASPEEGAGEESADSGQENQAGQPREGGEEPGDSNAAVSPDQEESDPQSVAGEPGGPEGEEQPESPAAARDPGESEAQAQQATAGADAPGEQAQDNSQGAPTGEDQSSGEQQQAMQQWLKQVPDDPGGLLRRKFHYQYSRRQAPSGGVQQW